MDEKRYRKRLDFQQKMITRQSEQIDELKLKNEELKQIIEEKDRFIKSIESLRKELTDNVDAIKQKKNEYETLVNELNDMKKIMNQEVYKNKWWLVRLLIK